MLSSANSHRANGNTLCTLLVQQQRKAGTLVAGALYCEPRKTFFSSIPLPHFESRASKAEPHNSGTLLPCLNMHATGKSSKQS